MNRRYGLAALILASGLASCDGISADPAPQGPGARTVAPPTCPSTARTDDRIEIRAPTPGATVHWRRIGDVDNPGFRPYDAPILVLEGGIEAIATTVDGDTSEPTVCVTMLSLDSTLAPPAVTPSYDTFEYALDSIAITSGHPGAVIRYTLDGSDVDSTAPVWNGPMALPRSGMLVVKALATAPGWHASRPTRRVFTAGAAPWNPLIPYDTLVDRRTGIGYPTLALGTQVWFAKNLFLPRRAAYDHLAGSGTAYEPAEVKADSLAPLCPEGWRIPSRKDWETLADWIRSRPLPSGVDPFLASEGGDPLGFRFLPPRFASYWSSRFLEGTYLSARGGAEPGFWTTELVRDSLVLAEPTSEGIRFQARPDTFPHGGDRMFPPIVPAAPIRCLRDQSVPAVH